MRYTRLSRYMWIYGAKAAPDSIRTAPYNITSWRCADTIAYPEIYATLSVYVDIRSQSIRTAFYNIRSMNEDIHHPLKVDRLWGHTSRGFCVLGLPARTGPSRNSQQIFDNRSIHTDIHVSFSYIYTFRYNDLWRTGPSRNSQQIFDNGSIHTDIHVSFCISIPSDI